MRLIVFSVAALAGASSSWTQQAQDVVRTLSVPDSYAEDAESLVELLNTVDHGARMHHRHATASLDRRRFWGNNKDACQAGGSPDTTDDDCHERRWGLMSNFAPIYAAQKRADRTLVLTEYDAEGILQQTYNTLTVNKQLIAGSDGTLSKPSLTNGLIYEANLMTNATRQLQGATLASMSILYDNVMNVTKTSISDTNLLKQNLATGLTDLMAQVKRATANQTSNANSNAQKMVGQANAALNSSLSNVQSQQKDSASYIASVGTASDKASSNFTQTSSKVKSQLNDASDAIDGFDSQVQSKVTQASTVISTKIGSAVDSITAAADESTDKVSSQGKQIAASLKSQTDSQLSDAQDSWSNANDQANSQVESLVTHVSDKIDSAAQAVRDSLANASDTTAGLINGTQSMIAQQTNAATQTAMDASKAASSLSSQVTGQSVSAKSLTNQLQSDVTAQQGESQKQLSLLATSAGTSSSQMMQSLIQSISQTQSDASNQNQLTAANLQAVVANKLSGLGSDTNSVAGLLSSLRTGIASGQSATGFSLESNFASTNAQADRTGSQLTGELDQVSASLVAAEQSLKSGANAVSGSVQATLNEGSNQAMQGVASLKQTNAGTQSKLLQSVLAAAQGAAGDSADMSLSAHGLLSALDSMGSETDSAQSALGSTQDSVDSATAALFGSVGDSDDAILNEIQAQVSSQKSKLNQFGSQFGSQQGSKLSAYWASVSSQLDQRKQASDKAASDAETGEQTSMSKADQLKKIANMLYGNLDELTSENEDRSDLQHSQFLNKLTQLGGQDDAAVTSLSAQLQGYQSDALQGIGGYLHQILGSENSDIGNSLSKQQALINTMKGTSSNVLAQSTRLQAVVAALEADSSSSRDSLIGKILSILDQTEKSTDSFSGQIDQISDNFNQVQSASSQSLLDLKNSINSEILKIPMILTSGAAKLQNDFALASSDLQKNILKLREKLATAQTDEDKEAAMQGLVVLNKLQGIQQGVSEADAKLRAQIESGAQQGLVDSGNVQGAMTSVLSAMESINSGLDSARLTVQADTETLGRQTATLVNGLNVMVNGTSDQLAQAAAQSALESRFNLNLVQARNKVRLASAVGGVNRTLSTFTNNADKSINDENQVSQDISTLKQAASDSRNALSARLDQVLSAVSGNADQINSGAVEGQSDVLTRLALVRMAMANFLGLWNEYAAAMDRKLAGFHASDSDFIALMETDLKNKLMGTEANLNTTDSKIDSLKQEIELGMSDEIRFENFFNSKISELKATLKSLNDDRIVKTIKANRMLNDFENNEAQAHSSAMQNIKTLIDKFDDTVLGHASQLDVFSGPTSLLEDEISRIEADARSSISDADRRTLV